MAHKKIRSQGFGQLPADCEHLREFVKPSTYTRRKKRHTGRHYASHLIVCRRGNIYFDGCPHCLKLEERGRRIDTMLETERIEEGIAEYYEGEL